MSYAESPGDRGIAEARIQEIQNLSVVVADGGKVDAILRSGGQKNPDVMCGGYARLILNELCRTGKMDK
ncbi:hypothetical protein [Streptomyces violaceorubidus]|uniref:Uncharacterized protein n=1 Tax=Streptomyces violaceorubidus TaxID=284042 RepID=A0ABV1STU0_9ACTN|nr:hypothetical protein [Streptomyces violaceorubidus]